MTRCCKDNQCHLLLPHLLSHMFFAFMLSSCRSRHVTSCLSPLPAYLESVALVLCNRVWVTFKSTYCVITSWHKTLVRLTASHVGIMLHSVHTGTKETDGGKQQASKLSGVPFCCLVLKGPITNFRWISEDQNKLKAIYFRSLLLLLHLHVPPWNHSPEQRCY